MITPVRSFIHLFVSDPAVRYSLLSRVVALGLGPLILLSVGFRLSPQEQGIYYVFGSLLQIRSLVDLGFSQSAQQLLAHAFGDLQLAGGGKVVGDEAKITGFFGLVRLISRVFLIMGAAALVLLAIGGTIYLSHSIPGSRSSWLGPWICLAASIAVGFALQGIPIFADSAGLLALSNKWRFFSEVCGVVAFLAVINVGGGLWAAVVLSWSRTLVLVLPLAAHLGTPILGRIRTAPPGTVNFRREVLPLQSRNMISWGAGFLVFYSYNLISLSLAGAVMAGVIGMTLQICNLVQAFSTVWFNAQIPRMGNLAGSMSTQTLRALHSKGMRVTLASLAGMSLGVVAASSAMSHLSPAFRHRFADFPALALFLAGTACCVWTHIRAAYVRAHRLEPFAPLGLAQGVATILLLINLLPRYGVWGAAICYASTMAFGALWVEIVFRQFKPPSPAPLGEGAA